MPPPSPVWASKREVGSEKVYNNATFKICVRIEGRTYESARVDLKVKGAPKKKNKDDWE